MLFRITDIKGSHGKIFLSSYYVSCCQVEWCQYSFLHIVWHEMLMNYLLSFDVGQYTTDAFWRETTRNFGRLLIVVWRLILTITYFNSDHGCYFKFINCMKEVIHNKLKWFTQDGVLYFNLHEYNRLCTFTKSVYCKILIERKCTSK